MHMTAASVLPLKSPPIILDSELGFDNLCEEDLPSLLEVEGCNGRVVVEINHPSSV